MFTTKKLVYTALFTALTAALTLFPRIPAVFGYIHLGDVIIVVSCFLIGYNAVISASIGSAIADLIGYPVYAPATLIIKLLMAVAICLLLKKQGNIFLILAAIAGELVMAAGYFVYEIFFYGFSVAWTSLPFNFLQAGAAVIISVPVLYYFKRSKRFKI